VVLAAAAVAGITAAALAGAAVATPSAAPTVPPFAVPAGRLLLDMCAVAAVGIAVLRWLIAGAGRRDAEAARIASGRAAAVVAGAWAATALVLLWLQAAELAGRRLADVDVDTVTGYLATVGTGRGLLMTAGFAIAFGVTAVCRWPEELLAVFAVLGLVPLPITGHSATAALHEVAVLSVALHAAAAAAWVGGLAALLVAAGARRALLATALPRFSGLAGWCVLALAATGVLNAVVRLGAPADVLGTDYGRILLAKTALLLVLAATGARIRAAVLPAVTAHRSSAFAGYATFELILMAVALGLAAALSVAAPPA